MRVRDLRKALEGLDDDMLVVTPGQDHNYRTTGIWANKVKAVKKSAFYWEYYGEELLEDGESVVDVFCVG